jgi:ubiquinol-cytochrome c reductase iron-sulfur subunit
MEDNLVKPVNRRDFLTMTAAALGVCGIGAAAIPFIEAMNPARNIIAAGVMEVDISGMKPGDFQVLTLRQQPLFLLKRTPAMVEETSKLQVAGLRDPATPEERAKRPDFLVCIGICTHLGCIPHWQPEGAPGFPQAGFYCPCHGGRYDSLGRRLAGPPPENLHLLPYEFIDDHTLRLGTKTFAGYNADIRKIQNLPRA